MKFKNCLEERCFNIASLALGDVVTVEHNKTLIIENALLKEVASFAGPPKKEVDVLAAKLRDDPLVTLLISCKQLAKKAEPAHVQEWCSVVSTMNRYADTTTYLGLVVAPTGFTSGCEPWATAHNIGLIPPVKGQPVEYGPDVVDAMLQRVISGVRTRLDFGVDDLITPPEFFDLVFRLVRDFEGHVSGSTSERYRVMPHGWASTFGEFVQQMRGRTIQSLIGTPDATFIELSNDVSCRVTATSIEFGEIPRPTTGIAELEASKNLDQEKCSVSLVENTVVGGKVTSVADFGTRIELGVEQKFNLCIHCRGVHVVSTENPIDEHVL